MTIKLCLIIMAYHFFSFRLFLTGHQVSNCPRYRFSPSAFRKQLTGYSGQTGRDFVFIFSLGHFLVTLTKMGKTNINLTSVTFHLYLAPQMLPSFSRRLNLNLLVFQSLECDIPSHFQIYFYKIF